MNAMLFLIRKEIKNKILNLFRHPAKLILYLAILVLLVMSVVSSDPPNSKSFLDIRILHGVYFAILTAIFVPSILSGLKSGTTFFNLSDVNFLFVSPISPKRILAYGLLKQMGTSLTMIIFLMFYSGVVCDTFGITIMEMLVLILGIAFFIFSMQIIALLIYNFTSGKPRRTKAVQYTLYALLVLIAGFLFYSFLNNGTNIQAVYSAISSPYLEIIPVIGWIKGLVFAVINNNINNTILFTVLNIITVAGSITLFVKSDSDYYGDVLQSTENAYEIKKAVKSGRSISFKQKKTKVSKVKETGINHGWGANAFFFRHILEEKRRRMIPYFKVSTVFMIAANLILAIILQKLAATDGQIMKPEMILGIALCANSYILFFCNAAGDWSRELLSPYIYLVPQKPFKKLIWASMTSILSPAVNGVLIFTALAIYVKADPLLSLIFILIYASVGFLFTSCNVLFQRILGSVSNNALIMICYMLLITLLIAPGIVASYLIFNMNNELSPFILGLPMFMCNEAISIVIFAACRNVLSSAEMNNGK